MASFQYFTISFSLTLSLLLLLLLLPFLVTSQSNRNVSLGSSLTAAASNAHWVSPSGDFAFGFEQVAGTHDDGGYLLAVVLDKIPERTVVWSANRNNLAPRGSKVELTTGGRLVLTDPSGRQIWTPDTGERAASHGAMLDTGNFVLAAAAANVVSSMWGSFQDPTDTLLPTQALERDAQLIAKHSKSNYSESRFKFIMQGDGNLVMYTTHYPESQADEFAYWVTRNYIRESYSLALNQSGFLNLLASNGTVLDTVFNGGGSSQDFYHRVTFDYDGVLRYYEHPKRNDSSNVWPMKWDSLYFEPPNICTAVSGPLGSGVCGYNSYCELEDDNHRVCKCPPKYVFQDPSDESRGCVPDFDPEDCRHPQESNNAFVLAAMPKVNWSESNYDSFPAETEDACQQSCLNDCRCALVTYSRETCTMKRSPLSNGRVEDAMSGKSLIKLRISNSSTTSSPPEYFPVPKEEEKNGQTLFVVGLVLSACATFFILFTAATFMLLTRRKKMKKKDRESGVKDVVLQRQNDWLSRNLQSFSHCQLELATGGFTEVLGSGASGTVYRGVLPPDQQLVAVKRLDKAVSEAQDQEFKTEVKVIGGTNHKNLVKLIGFCNEGLHRLLVYEFMSNGSLAELLFGGGRNSRPSWYTRAEIASAVARGLFYLHEECSTQIIHCDIKPQNILLDESMTAKISDFGLAKLLKVGQTRTLTGIRGTKGYCAPEWFKNMPVTAKVDVYSFGILLLELVCCRSKLEMEAENEDEVVLADWAYECYQEGQVSRLVESDDDAMANIGKVEKFVKVAIWCIQDDPSLRPGMNKIIRMLEGSVQIPIPPDPASFMSTV
ncbi:unnamed protein product [Linum trigynum]|uniref:Receptor-like serine/threonine-protein kinase n=1 Tax=Linum trigynum TaxID=586398 RepID=A0AAV2GFE1_9ROSI